MPETTDEIIDQAYKTYAAIMERNGKIGRYEIGWLLEEVADGFPLLAEAATAGGTQP